MPLNLFIDTNIFLSFYHFTADDLEELEKLAVLIQRRRVILWLPEQVKDEFWRNREGKINEALKELKSQKLPKSFPVISKGYPEFEAVKNYQKNYEKELAALIERIEGDVAGLALKADSVVAKLFKQAKVVPRNNALLDLARMRMDVGNPPGKKGSLGDAINWETLLAAVPEHEALIVVADDGDWRSPISSREQNYFLIMEWAENKHSQITYYQRLTEFFKDHFPNIKLAVELEKELLIKDLIASPAFHATHRIIARLRKFDKFTQSQVDDLIFAVLMNDQVGSISSDYDVAAFYDELYKHNQRYIKPVTWRQVLKRRHPFASEADSDEAIEDEEDFSS